VQDINNTYGYSYDKNKNILLVQRLLGLGFDDKDVVDIFNVIDSVCPNCYNADKGCQCDNDE
jgi:hypothetical protein